ncbi:MAG: efflux RND transporter permease subunit [Ignavibacteria bacterium]|nr:efflux RND transporter permease subunit [Ignavibacteria bacterium]
MKNEDAYSRFLKRPVAVCMFYAALVVGGIFAFTRLPLELAPSKEFPRLSIVTGWGSASPETVEMFITAPIEEIANTVRGVRSVSSTSEEAKSVVDVEFEPTVDMNYARLELNEKLAAFSEGLPPGVSIPTVERYIPKDFRDLQGFLSYSLYGTRSASELQRYAEERIAPFLMAIKGISRVQIYGGESREVQIEIDPLRMAAYGITAEEISRRLRDSQLNTSLGALDRGSGRRFVALRNNISSLDDIKNLNIAALPTGSIVRLSDVGIVRDSLAETRSYYRINGAPTVTIIIDKEPGTNALKLANHVFTRVDEIQEALPMDLTLHKTSDKSQQMRDELDKLYGKVIISLICIFVVLVLFLRNLTAPIIILSSIFFSLAGTFLFFWLFGIGLNLLTLAGLVLGFGRLVDDSIVVLENINRHQEAESGDPYASVPRSVREVALPVVASTFTTVGALLPIHFLPEDLKPYFVDFSIAVTVSLLMSLVVSFTLIPTISCRSTLRALSFTPLDWLGTKSLNLYRTLLSRALAWRKTAIACTIWLFGLPVWLLPDKIESETVFAEMYNSTIGSETYRSMKPYVDYTLGGASHLFFTKVPRGEVWDYGTSTYLVIWVRFPQGTEIERYNQVALDVERETMIDMDGIEKVTTRVLPDFAVVRIDFKESAAVTAIPYEIKNRLVVFAAQTGGATISVAGFGPGFFSGGESVPSFYVKVLGYNYSRVKEIAQEFQERIERNLRIAEVDIDRSFGRWNRTHQLVIDLDRIAIADHNLTVAEVIRAIRTHTRGALDYSFVHLDGERYPYSIKYAGYRDFSVDDLQNTIIVNSRGDQVRLSQLILFDERRVPSKILRENQQYMRWISFEYRGPYRFGDQFVDASIKAMPLPSGYSFDRSFGWLKEESQQSMLWIAVVAIIIVFMVTASLYESIKKPFIILLTIPFSFLGLFLSFYFVDIPFGRGGYAAVILLIGIVVTNSIVLVDYISKHVRVDSSYLESLIEASSRRVRPILMTTLTTIMGLVPLMIGGDKQSLWYSLSIGTTGGLISSVVLTLIVVPVVYALAHRPPASLR